MPKINGKEYPYTAAGKAAAKRAAKKAAPAKKMPKEIAKAIKQSNEKMKDMNKPKAKISGGAINKLLGTNGPKVKYFEKKFEAEKYPKDQMIQRQLRDRERTLGRANFIANREAKQTAVAMPRMAKKMSGTLGDLRPMPDKPRNAKPVPMPAPRQRGTTRPVPMPAPRQRGTTKKMMGR